MNELIEKAKDQAAQEAGFDNFEQTYVTDRKNWSIGSIYERAMEIYALSLLPSDEEDRKVIREMADKLNDFKIAAGYSKGWQDLKEEIINKLK